MRNDEKSGNHDPVADANVEPNTSDATLRTNEVAAFTAPCRITFHHIRKRLADLDGLSGKAIIDGLVQVGLLADDTAKQVAEIRHYQTKGEPEETRVVIESIEA